MPAIARAQPQQSDDAAEVGEVVVTGSLIRKKDFQSASPVQTIDNAIIANTGAAQMVDLFKGLTANAGSQISNEQNNLQGVSQFSLRGLGIGSTLTLVNGRRAGLAPVSDDTGQLFTDVNAFPVNFIERVEVLTDGASATYGSEAVAGVVNIITRSRFEGLELTADARTSTNEAYQIGGALGTSFERGHVSLFANYARQTGNFRSDFDFIRKRDAINPIDKVPFGGVFNSGEGSPGQFNLAAPGPNGTFVRTGNTLADPDCAAAGGIPRGTNCRYNFIDQRRIIPEEDRFQVFAQADYNVSDKLRLFTEISFSRNEIRDALGGAVAAVKTFDGGYLVPANHPFNYFVSNGAGGIAYAGPQAFTANPALQAVPLIYRGRPLGKASDGPNAEDIVTTFTNERFLAGLDYQIGDSWSALLSYTVANNRYSRQQPRDYDAALFQKALLSGAFNPFGTAITNPTLVGKDRVSLAGNTPEEIRAFAFTINDVGKVTQKVAELIISGDTGVSLPGGEVSLAVGGQYRELGFENTPDGRRQSGNNGRGEIERAVPFTRQKVYAAFGELALPILSNLNGQLALRYEDYGKRGGSTVDPKASFKFDVTDRFALRASWGTSFQAPSIRQASGSVGNEGVTDPRLGAAGGTFNVTVFTSGSPDLKSQSAENLNLGAIWRSDFGLSLSADYYFYDYKDLILPGGDPQSIVNAVETGALPASRVLRDPSGQLRAVYTGFENRGNAKAEGLDINARYAPPWWTLGSLTLDTTSTIITKFRSSQFTGLDGHGDLKGSRNFGNAFGSVPDFKINGGATLEVGDHSGNISVRYIGKYTDDQTGLPIKSYLTVDARYSLKLTGLLGGEESAITVGVINLMDRDPPLLVNRPLYDTEVHDPRGRQVYVSLKHRF